MNEQLQQEIMALEEQARIFAIDLERASETSTKTALQAEIDIVNAKLANKRSQVEAVEVEIQNTQTAITEAFDQIVVDGQTYSLRDFTINEQFAQVLYVWFQQKAGEIAQQYSAQAQSYKQENEELIDLMDDKDAQIASLRTENYRIDLIGADLQTKLENASSIIMEKDEEIRRLGEELKSIRENVAPKPTVTNSSGNIGDLMRAALASRPPIYNVRWKDEYKKNRYLATDAVSNEEIEFGHLELGKYRVIEESELWQFRIETAPVEDQVAVNETVSAVEPPPIPFQPDANTELDVTMGGESANSAMEGKTIEERLAALEAAVFG